ncbi:hypothetical protein [Saccharopolyspora shandongensis]
MSLQPYAGIVDARHRLHCQPAPGDGRRQIGGGHLDVDFTVLGDDKAVVA